MMQSKHEIPLQDIQDLGDKLCLIMVMIQIVILNCKKDCFEQMTTNIDRYSDT